MATISTALRHFKEPTKDQLTQIFFSIPPAVDGVQGTEEGEGMEINAVLSLGEAVEDSYVSRMVLDQSLTSLCTHRQGSCILCHLTWLLLRWIGKVCGLRYHYRRLEGLNASTLERGSTPSVSLPGMA